MDRVKLEGQILAGRYNLLEPLTSSPTGFSWVWRAHDPQMGREVALKLMSKNEDGSYDEAMRKEFMTEVLAMARVEGQHTVTIFDCGEGDIGEDEYLFLVMELLRGETLRDCLKRESRLPEEAILRLLIHVARSLRNAHKAKFIHRDLKPANIMLVPSEDGGSRAVVLDYGIAKALEAGSDLDIRTTKAAKIKGTALYLSPQQCAKGELTPGLDLYALGMIAYEALVGSNAHELHGRNSTRDIMLHLLRPKDEELPEAHQNSVLAPVIHKLLKASLTERYESCDELLEDLDHIQSRSVGHLPSEREYHALRDTDEDLPHHKSPELEASGIEEFFAQDPVATDQHPKTTSTRKVALILGVLVLVGVVGVWQLVSGTSASKDPAPQGVSRLEKAKVRQAAQSVAGRVIAQAKSIQPKPKTAPEVEPVLPTPSNVVNTLEFEGPVASRPPRRRPKPTKPRPNPSVSEPITKPETLVKPPEPPTPTPTRPEPEEPRLIIHEVP